MDETIGIVSCPHQLPVVAGTLYGVMHYVHQETHEPCAILNSLVVSTDDVLDCIQHVSSLTFFAAFAASAQIRRAYYAYLVQCDHEALEVATRQMSFLTLLPNVWFVAEEIDKVFGTVFWDNLLFALPEVYAKLVKLYGPSRNVALGRGEELVLHSLRSSKMTASLLKIKQGVESMRHNRRV